MNATNIVQSIANVYIPLMAIIDLVMKIAVIYALVQVPSIAKSLKKIASRDDAQL